MARLANLIISIAFVFLLDDDAFLPALILLLENDLSLFHHAWLEAHLGQRGVRWPLFDLDSRLDWVLKRSDHLARYTRFERAEFAELCSRLGIDIDSREKHHFKYCPVHRLMISLSRLSRNCSLWEMERQTQLSGQRVEDDFFRCVDLIIDVLDADNSDCNIRWFTDADAAAHQANQNGEQIPDFPEVLGLGDGLFSRFNKPTHGAASWWSVYRAKHGYLYQIITDTRGYIKFLSSGFQPTVSELDMIDFTLLARGDPPLSFPRGLMGMGDTAYARRPALFYAPYARDEMADEPNVSRADKELFNQKLRHVRVLSEHVNEQITGRWALLKEVSRIERTRLPTIMKCACLLANFHFVFTGIYPAGAAH